MHHGKYIVLHENPIPAGIGQGRKSKKGVFEKDRKTA